MKKLFLLLTAILCLAVTAQAQSVTVHGVVMAGDEDAPLVGATVMPLGGGQGVSTDIDGKFTLTLPKHVKQIRFSYVGYRTETVNVAPEMNVTLQVDNKLDEVVVTGYGSAKKLGSVVGSVSVVGEEQFENIPTATFVDALQGQVSGLSIYSDSGDPSSTDNSIRLRGVNSLMAGNTPLFILDGAPVTQSVFTTLNPRDIENITVLKDAASVAIYGSRAANGVIVITSKKGKYGQRARVSVRANYGWSQMTPDKVEMMNSEQYIKYRDLAGNPVTQEARDAWEKYGISTNWRNEIFDGSAPTYSLEGAVTGGSENLSYYLSLNHYEADGIIDQSHMRRETLRVNLNAKVTDWFRIGFQSNLGYVKSQTNNESNASYGNSGLYTLNPMFFARVAFPMDSPYYWKAGENGKAEFGDRALYLHFTQMQTPYNVMKNRSIWSDRVTANVSLNEQLNPIDGLTIRALQNVDSYDSRIYNYGWPKTDIETPMGDTYSYGSNGLDGYNQQSFGRYYQFTYTNTAEYSRTFNDVHTATVLAGQEAILSKSNSFGLFTDGYTDSRTMLLGQSTLPVEPGDLSQSIIESVFNSFFFNANYDYDNRYFIEGTFRRDGSSKFAPAHRWSSFYSVGAMWNAKNESFLLPYTWLDDLKLHLSYGTTGNSSIGNYAYFGLVGPFSTGYNSGTAWGLSSASNYDLTWETVRSFDLGLNFKVFNQLSGEINFYNKETVDMILEIPYSYTTGLSGNIGNIGTMRNRGIDVDLNWTVFNTKDWYWGIRGNFNYNQNRITKLFDGQDELTLTDTGLQYKVGHDGGEYYCVTRYGIDPRDGQQIWYDRDGNLTKVYNEERDAVLQGKSQFAPWTGGFGTDFRWKDLALKVDFNWAAKKYMINNDRFFMENNEQGSTKNQMTSMLNVWTTPGQVTDIPAVGQEIHFDSHLLEDASFLRLKNVTLTYSLPQNLLNKLYLQGLQFHFTGRNLLTFTNFTGYDPEPETNVVKFWYPNTRQYEFGIEVTF